MPDKLPTSFQKEVFVDEKRKITHVQLYKNNYVTTFEHISDLVKEAKSDFPELNDADIKIIIFGGISKKGFMAIRFHLHEILDVTKLKEKGYFYYENNSEAFFDD